MKKLIAILMAGLLIMTGCASEEKKQEKEEELAQYNVECEVIDKTVYAKGKLGSTTREGILRNIETDERYFIGGDYAYPLKKLIVGDIVTYNTKQGRIK